MSEVPEPPDDLKLAVKEPGFHQLMFQNVEDSTEVYVWACDYPDKIEFITTMDREDHDAFMKEATRMGVEMGYLELSLSVLKDEWLALRDLHRRLQSVRGEPAIAVLELGDLISAIEQRENITEEDLKEL